MYKKFLKKTIRAVSFSALIVILVISCVYMVSMVNFSSDNIDNTNAAYCRQMTNAMEMLVKQAKHQAYQIGRASCRERV